MDSPKDSRHERQSWGTNPLVSQGGAALAQAMAPFLDYVKLRRNIINKFDDKGRPDNKSEWVWFQAAVTMDGDRTRDQNKDGDRSTAHFHVMYLKPGVLYIGDIIWHKTFGMMKIEGFDGMTEAGLTTAKAIGINAGQDIEDGEAIRSKQREIF